MSDLHVLNRVRNYYNYLTGELPTELEVLDAHEWLNQHQPEDDDDE